MKACKKNKLIFYVELYTRVSPIDAKKKAANTSLIGSKSFLT